MLESLLEKFEAFMNSAAAFLWEQFDKDVAMTQSLWERGERLWAKISKRPEE